MQMTREELQRDATFKYVKFLCEIFDQAGIKGEPMELPIECIMGAKLPDYLPVAWAIRIKLLFCLAIYKSQGKFDKLSAGIDSISYYIGLVAKEMEKKV
jgi:hypothetical protein